MLWPLSATAPVCTCSPEGDLFLHVSGLKPKTMHETRSSLQGSEQEHPPGDNETLLLPLDVEAAAMSGLLQVCSGHLALLASWA